MINQFTKIKPTIIENMRNGKGTCILHKQTNLPSNVKLHALIRILPHSSIGYHTHTDDYEIMYCLKGKGIACIDGIKTPFQEGDSQILLQSHAHSLENETDEELIIIAFVGV